MANGAKVGELFVDLLLNDAGFNTALQNAGVQVNKLSAEEAKGAQATKTLQGALDSIGGTLTDFADAVQAQVVFALKAGAVALSAFGAASLYTGANFEQAMRNVSVISGATGTEVEALTAKARELGATTQYSATDAANAMQILASAGLNANKILAATGPVLMLAGAGATDMQTAAAAVTSTLAQFNMNADEAGRVADVFSAATAASTFEVTDLAEAMKYAGPVGSSFGYSLEETVAALAQFRDMGLQGSAAGTAFRSAMVAATKDTDRNREVLARYGLTMADINPELHSFEEIMQTVGRTSMTTTDTIEVFGTEAGGAIQAIAAKFVEGNQSFEEMTRTLESAAGRSTAMYDAMTDTILGKLGEVQSGGEEVLLSVFDTYTDSLKPFLEAVAAFFTAIAEEWQSRSGEISRGFGEVFNTLTVWLNANRDEFASMIVTFAQGLIEIAGLLARLIPYLDDIAILIATVFAAVRVTQFVAAVSAAVEVVIALASALWAGTLGIEGIMAALTAATGGVYALAAGIGVLVVGLVALVSNLLSAKDATEDLERAQARAAANAEIVAEWELNNAEKALTLTNEKIKARLLEAQANGTLTRAMEDELRVLSGLTAEEAARMEREGELIRTAEGYRLVTQAIAEGGDAAASVTQKLEMQRDTYEWTAREIAALDAMMKDAARTNSDTLRQVGEEGGKYVGMTVEAALVEIQTLKQTHRESGEYVAAIEKELTATTIGEIKTRSDADQKEEERKRVAAEQAAKKEEARRAEEQRLREESSAKTLELEERTAMELLRLRGDTAEILRIEYAQRRRELEQAFDKELDTHKDAADEVVEIERRKLEAIEELDKLYAMKRGERTAEQVAEAAQAAETQNSATSDSMRELQETLAAYNVDIGDGYEQAQDAQREFSEKAGEGAKSILDKFVAFGLGLWKKLREEMDKDGDGIVTNAEAVSYALGKLYDAAQGLGRGLAIAMQGALDVFEKLSGITLDFWSILADSKAAFDEMVTSAEDAVSRTANLGFTGAGDVGAVQTGKMGGPTGGGAAAETVTTMIDEAMSMVNFLVASAPVIVRELAAQLPIVGRQIIDAMPGLINALVAELPALLSALIDIVFDLLIAFVEMLPTVLPPILAMIPPLIAQFAERIPDLIKAIVDNLPGIIDAIIAALPAIFEAIIAAIPEIIIAVVKALPTIVSELVRLALSAVKELALALWDSIKSLFTGGGKDKNAEEAYAGVDYVPSTMRMTVHEGERIIPAERNPTRARGANPAAPGAQRGTAGATAEQSVEVSVLVDGAVVDGVVVRANAEGRATGVGRMVRRATGARVGYDRGGYSFRNK